MSIIKIINEEINRFNLNEESIWYHGTPDARELQSGGFQTRTNTTDYIADPEKWSELQKEMQIARNTGNEDQYFQLLDQAGALRKTMTYKKPIYFTDNHRVASTYSDPQRAFDYQNSEPKLLQARINNAGNILEVPARGQRFRMIDADVVKKALSKADIPDEQIENYFKMFPTAIRNNKMSAETIGIIAQLLGFDMVDVQGVLDSYHGGTIESNVRMVFDPNRIKIIK